MGSTSRVAVPAFTGPYSMVKRQRSPGPKGWPRPRRPVHSMESGEPTVLAPWGRPHSWSLVAAKAAATLRTRAQAKTMAVLGEWANSALRNRRAKPSRCLWSAASHPLKMSASRAPNGGAAPNLYTPQGARMLKPSQRLQNLGPYLLAEVFAERDRAR